MTLVLFLVLGIIGIGVIALTILCFIVLRGAFYGAPFVPSKNTQVLKMVQGISVKDNMVIYDAGCGDGRILFSCESLLRQKNNPPKKLIGIDIACGILWWAQIRKWLLGSKSTFLCKSIWGHDFSEADVIFVYLLPKMMQRFEREVYPTLQTGAQIICNGFPLPNIPFCDSHNNKSGKVFFYTKKEEGA